jgi:hypothetical protein
VTRVLNFSDGFTSTTAPTGAGGAQENYTISNNTTAGILFTTDYTTNRTVFFDYELKRQTSLGIFVQAGSSIMSYDTSWALTQGNYQGDEIIVDTISSTEHVKLILNSSTGALTYDSGNMTGTSYVGTFKITITRIV